MQANCLKIFILSILFMMVRINFGNSQNKEEAIPIYNAATGQIEMLAKIYKTEEEWRKLLTPLEFRVTRKKGTEPAFSGKDAHNKEKGTYKCVCCGTDLFSSEAKFDSGTGWPSFWQPIAPPNIQTKTDRTFFMNRIEVLCPRCEAHLGHVFDDGPPPTHKRFCINSLALRFVKQ